MRLVKDGTNLVGAAALLGATLALGCAGGGSTTGGGLTEGGLIEPNEVAVLFPLPASMEQNRLLSMTDVGAQGELLPKHFLEDVEDLTAGLKEADAPKSNAELWPLMRAVTAYPDPCWPRPDYGCEPQIRVSFQPIVADAQGRPTTLNVAVHVHYNVHFEDFGELAKDLATLKRTIRKRPEAPVGIHPEMVAEGPGGPFADGYQKFLLKWCGDRSLVSVTFLAPDGRLWGAFDFHIRGRATDVDIPATDGHTGKLQVRQRLLNQGVGGDLAISVNPTTPFSDRMSLLFDSSRARAAPRAQVIDAVKATWLIDDPSTPYNPVTTDCVSCHIATPVRRWAQRNLDLPDELFENAFRTHWNTSLDGSETADDPTAHLCLGYVGRKASVGQRTVNDAAMNSDIINDQYVRE